MRHCSECGAAVQIQIPAGDNRPRHVCPDCGVVHYQNPKLIVGCIPEWGDQLLLCRRAIQPRYGLWTLPAGFMETGETAQAGAARETLEESGATVEVGSLHTMYNLPYASQMYLLFRAKLVAQEVNPGIESLEVEFFREKDIPWLDIAFPVIRETLWLHFRDRERGYTGLHTGDIVRVPGDLRRYHIYSR